MCDVFVTRYNWSPYQAVLEKNEFFIILLCIIVSTFSPVASDFSNPSAADHKIIGCGILSSVLREVPLNSEDQGPRLLVYAAALMMYSVLGRKLIMVYEVEFISLYRDVKPLFRSFTSISYDQFCQAPLPKKLTIIKCL